MDGRPARPRLVERVAAVVALASLVAGLVVAVLAAVSSWRGVVVMLSGLLLTVVAGWFAVSRVGRTRSVATAGAAVGVAVLVAGLVMADVRAVNVAAIATLAALSVGSAQVALHRSSRALRRAALSRTPVAPARHPVLFVNPKSGGGKADRFQLVDRCRERGIDAVVLGRGDDLAELAEQAIARGADVIGMAGGDGSQALVASVAARHGVPHVVVPAGTMNHFALDLGLDRRDVVGALDAFHDGVERRVDLATVNGRVFVNNTSVGLYARIVQSPGYRDDKRGTAAEMLPQLLGPDAAPMDLRFTGPDGTAHPTAQLVMVSNNPYDFESLAGRGTRERVDGGVLGIVAVRVANAPEFSALVALEAAGRAQRFAGWLAWTGPAFRIDSDEPVEIGIDGEAMTLDPPLLFETRPGALRVRLPRLAIGRSPTARAVHVASRTTIAELARVAAGAQEADDRHG